MSIKQYGGGGVCRLERKRGSESFIGMAIGLHDRRTVDMSLPVDVDRDSQSYTAPAGSSLISGTPPAMAC